jgi:hypothetical protein
MTYFVNIINLFINNYLNGIALSIISKTINIFIYIQTLRRWINLYENNIINKLPLKNEGLFKKNF